MEIQKDIKEHLKTINKTCADLARTLEISYEVLNRQLNGRANLPEKIRVKIYDYFLTFKSDEKDI